MKYIQKPIGISPDDVHWLEEQSEVDEVSFAAVVRRAIRFYRHESDLGEHGDGS